MVDSFVAAHPFFFSVGIPPGFAFGSGGRKSSGSPSAARPIHQEHVPQRCRMCKCSAFSQLRLALLEEPGRELVEVKF